MAYRLRLNSSSAHINDGINNYGRFLRLRRARKTSDRHAVRNCNRLLIISLVLSDVQRVCGIRWNREVNRVNSIYSPRRLLKAAYVRGFVSTR